MAAHAFIIGGSGQIGIAIAEHLLAKGWRVTLASRGRGAIPVSLLSHGVQTVTVDRSETGALTKALRGGCDLLIDTLSFDSVDADQLLMIQQQVGAIVAISSISVYTDASGKRSLDEAIETGFPEFPIPVTERQPTLRSGSANYSTRKVAMEERLLAGAKIPTTVLRPGAIYGPHSHHPREWWFVKRLLDGRKHIPLAYGGRSQFQPTSTQNLAALVETVASRRFTGILNAVDADCPTVTEIGNAIMAAVGREAELVGVSGTEFPPRVGANPWGIPSPFIVSDAAARALGYAPVASYVDAVVHACQWLVGNYDGDWRAKYPELAGYRWNLFDYATEDGWLTAPNA